MRKTTKAMRVIRGVLVSLSAVIFVVADNSPAVAQNGTRFERSKRLLPERKAPNRWTWQTETDVAPLGLGGYSPVTLRHDKRWVKGSTLYRMFYDGRNYRFRNQQERQAFLANPSQYLPVLRGDCVVSFVKVGERVPGSSRYGSYHDDRLFLFANEEAKRIFDAEPEAFAQADLALGGLCPVSSIDLKQDIEGKPEITALIDGFRYQFSSEERKRVFLKNPRRYAIASDDQPLVTGKPRDASSRSGSNLRRPPSGYDSRD